LVLQRSKRVEGFMICHHYCNEPMRCPSCVRRFWLLG
jgi:hypothetical protein